MKRVLLAVVCGFLLTVGLVGPSGATEKAPPTAPQSLTATMTGPTSVELSWSAPIGYRSAKLTSYTLTWAELGTGRDVGSRKVSASTLSTTLVDLEPGLTYRARVAASHGRGRGPWAQVSFTVPPSTTRAQGLFAVDTVAHTLVRFPLVGGASTTLLTGVDLPGDLAIDPAGNAYLVDDQTVIKVPADGSAPSTFGSGFQVETDDAGYVYVAGSAGVVRTTPAGQTSTITSATGYLGVTGPGVVKVLAVSSTTGVITTSAPGLPLTTQALNIDGYLQAMLVDDAGNLYLRTRATGGSGAVFWQLVKPADTLGQSIGPRIAEYAAGLGPDGQFYLGLSGSWCIGNTEDFGTCTPDRNVAEILRFPLGGGSSTGVPITGLRTSRSVTTELAVDGAGFIYGAQQGPTPGLLRYPATGGAPTRLADGTYALLTVG